MKAKCGQNLEEFQRRLDKKEKLCSGELKPRESREMLKEVPENREPVLAHDQV